MPRSFGALEVAVVGRSGTVSWAVVVVVVGATVVAVLGAPGRQALDGNVVFFVCYVELYPSAVATGFEVVPKPKWLSPKILPETDCTLHRTDDGDDTTTGWTRMDNHTRHLGARRPVIYRRQRPLCMESLVRYNRHSLANNNDDDAIAT